MRGGHDYSEIAALIQKSIEPLISKLDSKVDRLSDKVDELARNRVTREDMDKLRGEMHTTFVAKDPYEVRHANLIARDTYLESEIKRIDSDTQLEFQRLHERLESGKQQLEDRMTKEKEVELNSKDRNWIRGSQLFGIISIVISVLTAIATLIVDVIQHIRIQ